VKLEVLALIYKSTDFLTFISNQLKDYCQNFDDIEVSLRIVANDPIEKVEKALKLGDLPYSIYHDHKPNDYYLNRVYRCWNFAGESSSADLICFVNSDMAFTEGWLKPLVDLHKKGCLPTSRLVESGKMPSGTHGFGKNFGIHPREFQQDAWLNFAKDFKTNIVRPNGLFMPVIFDKNEFIENGKYPEGNIYRGGAGTLDGFIESGDAWFFRKFSKATGREHVTAFSSLVYHMQEGEMDYIEE
jgi:hypothetical protein